MSASRRAMVAMVMAGAACLSLGMLGFVVFANSAVKRAPDAIGKADAIVVLTGAHRRIDEGMRLLKEGLGRRLLISGVNPRTSPRDVQRLASPGERLFDCCVDFGYDAQDTIGNADETRAWANHHHFSRLIVVTSSYHMPRSLSELSRVLPDAELVAYPVVPPALADRPWWLHPPAIKILATEYVKLLTSAIRYATTRLMRPQEPAAPPAHVSPRLYQTHQSAAR